MGLVFATSPCLNLETKEGDTITTFCFMVQMSTPKTHAPTGNKALRIQEFLEKTISTTLLNMLPSSLAEDRVAASAMELEINHDFMDQLD